MSGSGVLLCLGAALGDALGDAPDDALDGALRLGFAGLLQRAGSRPGWRVTFLFDDKKVTKETSFELGAPELSAGPGHGAAPRLFGSNITARQTASDHTGSSAQHTAIVIERGLLRWQATA